jgi:hypothetical protein
MKDQYVGDVNDYRKYGLLRILNDGGRLKTSICWMLTDDDCRHDGGKIDYLDDPDEWRHHDPELFDQLNELVNIRRRREVRALQELSLFRNCSYYPEILRDQGAPRNIYFDEFFKKYVDQADLVFFDPDNGYQVGSVKRGRRGSSKYVYQEELRAAFERGSSILLYQHYPRSGRKRFAKALSTKIGACLGSKHVRTFGTPFVLFLLFQQPRHEQAFQDLPDLVTRTWGKQIETRSHTVGG